MKHAIAPLLCMLALGSCEGGEEVELPEPSHHGVYVSMGVEGDAEPCGGTLAWMDRHVETLGEVFERSVEDVSIAYYWLMSPTVSQLCGADAYACAPPDTVYSTGPLLEHELVHALVDGWTGQGERFFAEGLAVALGDYIYGPYQRDEFGDALAMIGRDRTLDIDYPTAGAFVTYLIEVHGAPAVLAFYDATSRESSRAEVAAAFEQSFGATLESAQETFLARGRGCTMLLSACSLPPLPWVDGVWTTDAAVACSANGLGPDSGAEAREGVPWGFVSFEITEPGSYRLELEGPAYPLFAHHCGPCDERIASVEFGVLGEAEAVELAAGRYVVHLPGHRSHDRVFPLRVSLAG